MGLTGYLLLAIAVAAPAPNVEVVTLQGQKHAGTFVALTAESLSVQDKAGKAVKLPVGELMHVKFPTSPTPKPSEKPTSVVTLIDGTQLTATQVTTDGRDAVVNSVALGKLKFPVDSLANIRFGKFTPKYAERWKELLEKETKKDYLVVPRTTKLDFVAVVVDRITEKDVHFAFNGQDTNLPHERFFGVIFARPGAKPGKPVCNIQLGGGDSVQVDGLTWDGSKLQAKLVAGAAVEVPLANVSLLDFSLGKIRYLSEMEPRDEEFTPFFDDKFTRSLFRYRRDQTYRGQKLQIGKTVYDRGLWIHSRTVLRYRLAGDYRRFRAVMGIDHDVAKDGKGFVRVVISGDKKKLFEGDVRGTDAARELDLDVTGVRDLEILVDYGDNDATADHLDLAEARIVK